MIYSTRRWRCEVCQTVTQEPDLLTAPNPFDPTETLTGCPNCKQAEARFALLCDEPGCNREASCGFPVEGGYRHACGTHRAKGERQ
jgi:hypothetical protein